MKRQLRSALRSAVLCAFAATALAPASCGRRPEPGRESLDRIRGEISDRFICHDYAAALSMSSALRDSARAAGDRQAYLTGTVYSGQACLCIGRTDSMLALMGEARPLAERLGDRWALATICNILGVHALYSEMDFERGISYLVEGVSHAEHSGNDRLFVLKSNLALAYYMRDDPAGLPYALDVYEPGLRQGDSYMLFSGAVTSAYMYYVLGMYDRALRYIRQAEPLTDTFGDRRGVHTLFGDILLGLGREAEAVRCYRNALSDECDEGRFSGTDVYLSYGRYLMSKDSFPKAVKTMLRGIRVADSTENYVNRYKLYRAVSQAFERLGDIPSALLYYKLYHRDADSVFNADRERSIGELKVRYERERYENRLRLEKSNWQKRLLAASFLGAIAVAAAVRAYVLSYRRTRKYRRILQRHQQELDRERRRSGTVSGAEPCGGRPGDAAARRNEELFGRLQELMLSERPYREHGLSRDRVAGMLSTNRTYLTETIREFTGLPFVYYVNSFRINDAVAALSDPENDVPIKALSEDLGFSSLSTFYKFFQAATGMTPSRFRETAREGRISGGAAESGTGRAGRFPGGL